MICLLSATEIFHSFKFRFHFRIHFRFPRFELFELQQRHINRNNALHLSLITLEITNTKMIITRFLYATPLFEGLIFGRHLGKGKKRPLLFTLHCNCCSHLSDVASEYISSYIAFYTTTMPLQH